MRHGEVEKLTKLAERMMNKEQKAQSEARAAETKAAQAAEYRALLLGMLAQPNTLLASMLERVKSDSKETLDRYAEKFKANPAYALEWAGDEVFDAAARYDFASGWLAELHGGGWSSTENPFYRAFADSTERRAKDLARGRSRSTSATSNLMDEARRVTANEVVEKYGPSWFRVPRFYSTVQEFANRVDLYRAGKVEEALALPA